jgi:hypothetical protein
MNEAGSTWALVAGIDEYDHPSLRRLTGAAADAVAAVGWLRSLGVPDGQILLHAAPSAATRPALDALGLPYGPAREPDLWDSIDKLRGVTGGTRLFVFLSGHGLYDPASRRLFLTQEARPGTWSNLGMDLYVELFRSLGFARQFLFLDGCQNYPYPESTRPTVSAAMHVGVAGFTARPENTLLACYAAAQDQLAVEIGGRGAMMRFLLDGLNLSDPCAEAVVLDFATGERTVDLRQLFALCRQKVERDAGLQQPPVQQTPQLELWGRGGSDPVLPIVRLPDLPTAAVRVAVSPATAGKDLKRLRIFADEPPQWDLRLPALPGDPVALPLTNRLPVGLQGYAQCTMRPGAPWDLAQALQQFEVAGDRDLVFELEPKGTPPITRVPGRGDREREPAPRTTIRLRTLDEQGKTVYNTFQYDEIAKKTGSFGLPGGGREVAAGVFIEHHEHGPDFEVEADALSTGYEVATRWAQEIQKATPAEVSVSLDAPKVPAEQPNLRLVLPPGGALALAGVLAYRPVVWVGPPADAPKDPAWKGVPRARSLSEVEAGGGRERVEPGPVLVRVDLPWGSWSSTVRAPLVGEAVVELPTLIGRPPLRVGLRGATGFFGPALLGVEGEAPAGSSRPGLDPGGATPFVTAPPGRATWALTPGATLKEGEVAIAELAGGRWNLVLYGGRTLAVDRSREGFRVEPLSAVPSPSWDLLMALGRLDALSAANALELTASKWDDWLLGLAGAYAVYANPASHSPDYLEAVLGNLDRLGHRAPDFDLLRIVLRSGGETPAAESLSGLRPWAEAGSVPLLRWGVPLALRLLEGARDEPLVRWRDALAEIGRRLSPISTWTAWTGAPGA